MTKCNNPLCYNERQKPFLYCSVCLEVETAKAKKNNPMDWSVLDYGNLQ